MESVKFKNKITGEIVTQVPISEINNYEKLVGDAAKEVVREEWDKMKEFLGDNIENAKKDIRTANKEIQKRHRYFCGIVTDEQKDAIGCGDMFFESPDGQNGELYMELKKLGYRNAGFNAEYYWKVRNDKVTISYVEGDIYIKNNE